MKYYELNGNEKINLESVFNATFEPKKVKIKMNFGVLLIKNEPNEFSVKDKHFFDEFKNKEVFVIKDYPHEGYFILEDNNYLIYDYCFDELGVK